jgi:hypothetical protein
MRVKLLTAVMVNASETFKGSVLEVPDATGADWVTRGLAEKSTAAVFLAPPPEPEKPKEPASEKEPKAPAK